jgi:hypothetical protein
VKRENNEITMLCEYYRWDSQSSGSLTFDDYYFNDILVTNFDKEGNMIKTFYIPKQQLRKGDQLTSFISGMINNKLIFVYFDSEKNYGKKGYIGEEMSAYGDAIVGAVTCDFDGNITNRKIIYRMNKSDNKSPYMDVKNSIKVNDNKYFIPCIIKNNYQYGFLTFE